MRKLYIVVSLLFLASIVLFIAAFLYLDSQKHKTYHYIVNLDGHDVGSIEIEKFVTEEKIIYKSISSIPFKPILTDTELKMTLDRRYNLETYSKKNSIDGVWEAVYLENRKNGVSFLAVFESQFACLDNIPVKSPTFVFEEDSLVTYLPMIENYDFKKGRTQAFNTLAIFSTFLPPMRKVVTMTSIKEEILDVDARKIKAEHLLLKSRNYTQVRIWASKLDKSLIMIEVPKIHLKIRKTFRPKTFKAEEYSLKSEEYIVKDVIFKSETAELAGRLTVPKKGDRYPAVLLVWGAGPQDREYQGFFTSIADYLSRNGFCVLGFDKQGVGSSSGDASSAAYTNGVNDINAAVEYLSRQRECDPKRIALIGHSEGAVYASRASSENEAVRALVLMALLASPRIRPDISFEELKNMVGGAFRESWSDDYLMLIMKSTVETNQRAKSTKNNWISILGKRCFVKRLREESEAAPITDVIKKLSIPVLILQGKDDESLFIESASILDKALEEGGNKNHALTYFGYLGHFFGRRVNDGMRKIHYEVDQSVLESIRDWLKEALPYGS